MFAAGKTAAVSGAGPDDKFNYVTMLLHGDGTNGAQNNTFLDSSTNNFSITRNGNTTQGSFSPYGSNWSNNFDGTGDYLSNSSAGTNFGTGSFTVECWFFRSGAGPNPTVAEIIVDFRTTDTTSGNFAIVTRSNGQVAVYGLPSSTAFTEVGAYQSGWNHVAVGANGTNFSVWINGTRVYNASANSYNYTQSGLYIGAATAAVGGYNFNGYISNFRAVKGTDVYGVTNTTITVPTAPLTAITNTVVLTCQSNRFIDNSSGALVITRNGDVSVQRFNPFGTSTAYSTSVIGGSGYFDGSGDYLVSPASSSYQFAGDFTIEYWANLSVIDGVMPIGQTYTGNNFQIYYSADGSIEFGGSNLGLVSTSAGVIVKNSWHHGALVRSGSTVTLYINGVSKGTITSSSTVGNNADIGIGARPNNAYNCTGYISNVRLVSSAVYTTTFTPPTTPFTAISGTVLLLSTTNGAIFDNAMMNDLETVGNAQISTSVKKYGTGSMYFDGTGDYLKHWKTTNITFDTGAFTFEFWFQTSSSTQYATFFSNESGGGGFTILINSSAGNGVIQIYNGGSGLIHASSAGGYKNGVWHHLALSRDSSGSRLFINGTQQGATNSGQASAVFDGGDWIIGNNLSFSGRDYNGYIDDFRITKGYARYTSTFTPPTSALSDTGPY